MNDSFMNRNNIEVNTPMVIVAVVSFIFCYVFFCILQKGPKSFNQRFIAKCRKENSYTQGYAVSSTFIRGDDESSSHMRRADKRKVRYEYTVDGQRFYKTFTFSDGGRAGVKYPQNITIFYNKNNPRKCAVSQGQAKVGSYLLAFFIPVALTFLTYVLTK